MMELVKLVQTTKYLKVRPMYVLNLNVKIIKFLNLMVNVKYANNHSNQMSNNSNALKFKNHHHVMLGKLNKKMAHVNFVHHIPEHLITIKTVDKIHAPKHKSC